MHIEIPLSKVIDKVDAQIESLDPEFAGQNTVRNEWMEVKECLVHAMNKITNAERYKVCDDCSGNGYLLSDNECPGCKSKGYLKKNRYGIFN